MAPVTLYLVRLSPTCRIVWLYLLQNNIEHVLVDIKDLDDLESATYVRKFGGHAEVPILTDGDIVVFEAPAILEYLAKTYTQHKGFGKQKTEQTRCSSIISWTNSEIHRITGYNYIYPNFFEKFQLETESANEALIDNGIQQLTKLLSKIESRYLTTNSFLCGSQPTVADSFLATTVIQAQWAKFNFSMWPKLISWAQKVSEQPYWNQVHEAHHRFVQEIQAE